MTIFKKSGGHLLPTVAIAELRRWRSTWWNDRAGRRLILQGPPVVTRATTRAFSHLTPSWGRGGYVQPLVLGRQAVGLSHMAFIQRSPVGAQGRGWAHWYGRSFLVRFVQASLRNLQNPLELFERLLLPPREGSNTGNAVARRVTRGFRRGSQPSAVLVPDESHVVCGIV